MNEEPTLELMRNLPNGAYCVTAYISAKVQFWSFIRSIMCNLGNWPNHFWRGKVVKKIRHPIGSAR